MTEPERREFLLEGTRTAKVATVMADGAPHVMPVWFVLDGDRIVFMTGRGSVKGRDLSRDPRVSIVVEDDTPPFAFVHVRGRARISEDLDAMLQFATAIGARYMGADRATEFGLRNAVPGVLLVSVSPERIITLVDAVG